MITNPVRRTIIALFIGFGLMLIVLGVWLIGAESASAQTNPAFHPPITLLDAEGTPVLDSGAPVSTLTTCGTCHDAAFIAASSGHADGALRAVSVSIQPDAPAPSSGVEINCFLCHTAAPDNASRLAAIDGGQPEWASSATLLTTGLISAADGGWTWNTAAFNTDGSVPADVIGIQDPTDANCGTCHGTVHTDAQTPLVLAAGDPGWETLLRGQVVSPQRISGSGLNLEDKPDLTRVWDVHAERVVGCTDCHYAINNPVYDTEPTATRPDHLTFDPRRMDFGEYLYRPVHTFANSTAAQDASFSGAERPCASCHDAVSTHTWLPYAQRHMDSLACETCHIPTLYAPALERVDFTAVQADGAPLMTYRGLDGDLITGFQPVLLPAEGADGGTRLAPYNLVSRWYWVDASGAAVSAADVQSAWLVDGAYAPEIVAAFDADGSGTLDEAELALDTQAKIELIAARLADIGIDSPRISADVQPFAVHHNVIGGEWATGDCATCHADQSRLAAPIVLTSFTPGGVDPTLDGGRTDGALIGSVTRADDGTLWYQPALAAAPPATELVDLYVLGHHDVDWINAIGALMFAGVAAGASVHAGLRFVSARRQAAHQPAEVRPVYMYSVYERFWHWMQTVAIFGLLFTGLVIHMPDVFSMFSFQVVVLVHNALALLLVVNAALSLFYHLVSGEIRQFLPRPYGFFDQMFAQAKYYLWGIFRGAPHPFAKTPDRKLNPMQQLTYFAILNVLLPLQIITGALMWGAQQFPTLTAQLGGLGFLAPFHTLIAWTFAAFIVLHVYIITTGHTPTANLKAMMLGWEEVETESDAPHSAASVPSAPQGDVS